MKRQNPLFLSNYMVSVSAEEEDDDECNKIGYKIIISIRAMIFDRKHSIYTIYTSMSF